MLIEFLELPQFDSSVLNNCRSAEGKCYRWLYQNWLSHSNIDAPYNQLKNLNVNFPGSIVHNYSGKKMFRIKDPDENPVRFFEE